MAMSVYWAPKSMNAKKYNDAVKALRKVGQMHPKGREYHVCFGSGNKLQVFEVWKSRAQFKAFGRKLMPVLKKTGLKPGTPMTAPVKKIIEP